VIIGFPTALYLPELPRTPEDGQSITFLVSSEDPPRSSLVILELFRGEELRSLPDRIHEPKVRRNSLGKLVFNVSAGGRTETMDGRKQFESGQILEFGPEEQVEQVVDDQVPETVSLQQDTNELDLSDLGLDDEQVAKLVDGSERTFARLITDLKASQNRVADAKAAVIGNQRRLNEVRKALEAAKVALAGSGDEIVFLLEEREGELVAERSELIAGLNEEIGRSGRLYADLLDVRELVR